VTTQAFVINDLHIGGGAASQGLEDFHQDAEFAQFVRAVAQPETTLIVNGDFIDFAQIPPYDVAPLPNLLWSQEASKKKLETALTSHPKCFDALRDLVGAGADLCIIIGNHDLDLAWEGVQTRLRQLLGASSPDRIAFIIGHTVYHGVWIEHGHEFTPENSPVKSDDFIHTFDMTGERYLERVWGTDFMLQFYNDLERRYPFADKVKPTIAAFWQGLKHRWVGAKEFVHFMGFLKRRGIPWSAITSAVLAEPEVKIQSLVGALDDPQWRKVLQTRAADADFMVEFTAAVAALPSEEKKILAWPDKVKVSETDFDNLDKEEVPPAETLGIFRENRELRAARDRRAKSGVTHVVFGHTHEVVNGALDGRLFNTGTWIARLNLGSPDVRKKVRQQGLTLQLLSDPSLYVTDRLAVHIVPQSGHQAQVKMIEAPSFVEWRGPRPS
jgi:UDP-2,3-diacylglucosamine pyrophosphatase LpxH